MNRLCSIDIWRQLVEIARGAMGDEGLERRGLSMALDGDQLQVRCGDRDTTWVLEHVDRYLPLDRFAETVLRPMFETVFNTELPCLSCGAQQDAGGALPCGH
ncbi:hypothetical protein BX589_12044 [Paraburkholderia fungorum]|uniref:hypothetical protein n=1 Tax=Paraburkholderia fungorum TaxID=134537 RepID=UPI000D06C81B|nr:hypothetical protein [Paraburkholderia fungorum]PRZ51203.1 hypothetical protein BX589_12044 [Paraburkholderia fungorum]